MAAALSRILAQHGSRLTRAQRISFARSLLCLDHPASCEAWDFIWKENWTDWDFGPTDVLCRLAGETQILTSTLASMAEPHALVPGCGRGYDALALASMGFKTWGIDISTTAIESAREWIASHADDNHLDRLDLVVADFFDFTLADRQYSIVHDGMFFCALPPILRDAWGKRMSKIVQTGGHLSIVLYSSHIPEPRKGPPYSMNVDMVSDVLAKAVVDCDMVWKKSFEIHLEFGSECMLAIWTKNVNP